MCIDSNLFLYIYKLPCFFQLLCVASIKLPLLLNLLVRELHYNTYVRDTADIIYIILMDNSYIIQNSYINSIYYTYTRNYSIGLPSYSFQSAGHFASTLDESLDFSFRCFLRALFFEDLKLRKTNLITRFEQLIL